MDIPKEYPLKPLSVVVADDQAIPKVCILSINSAIREWLAAQASGALMLRPFLHWLDKVITMLVQDSIPEEEVDTTAAEPEVPVDDGDEDGSASDEGEDEEVEKSEVQDENLPQTVAVKRGTEIRLKDLVLGQYVGTVVFPTVKLVAECTRCKHGQDMTVTAEK